MSSYRDDAVSMIANHIEEEEKKTGGSLTKPKTKTKVEDRELDIDESNIDSIADEVDVSLEPNDEGEEE